MGGNGFSAVCAPGGVVYIKCGGLDIPHAFSTRVGGVSKEAFSSLNMSLSSGDRPENIAENRARLFAAAGLSPNVAFTRQVHGAEMLSVSSPLAYEDAPECDGLYTETPGLTLCGSFADCVPVLLYDPSRRAAAVVHSGWRGTAAGICGRTIDLFASRGSRPCDIVTAIFPAISRCCFTVQSDVPDALLSGPVAGFAPGYIRDIGGGRFSVDLKGICAQTLRQKGVERIFVSKACTCCESELFFSHRRTGLPRGGMAACICLV